MPVQDRIERPTTVAIIGAGIAGLTCANSLQAQGLKVQVFEKSRGVGGRMSTRRGPTWQCDHGAQYFTARSAAFRAELARWEAAGVAEPWPVRIRVIDDAQRPWRESSSHTKRYVGVPGMTAPAQFLAASLPVQLEAHIDELRREPSGWRLHILGKGWQDCLYDALALALPAPQAHALLKQTPSVLQELVGTVRMRPAWALMMHCEESFDPGFDAAFVNSGPIRWVARNLSKPQRKGDNMWLVHATAQWSETHLEAQPNEVASILAEAFQEISPVSTRTSVAHRWRYADTEALLGQDFLWDSQTRLGVCGDWLQEAKVEGAWWSAFGLAKVIASESRGKYFDIKLISIEFASFQYESALELRNVVLRNPLGRSLDFEDLEGEDTQLHFGIMSFENKLIACVSVKILGENHYKIRQMAVANDCQHQGIGARLLRHVESKLVHKGGAKISLHARESAIAFYEKLGFHREGELFDEVGIPHIEMHK